MIRFKQYAGDTGRLPTNDKHLNFLWIEPDCFVLFSVSRKGNAASCHFTSDKPGMEKIRQAINEFVDFVFSEFLWCEMIFAKIRLEKVRKIIRTCGFIWTLSTKKYDLYTRRK